MFEQVEAAAPDAILRTMVEFNADSRADKIDLGVGVFKTAEGLTPVLDAVKQAERRLVESQTSKSYLGSAGSRAFGDAMNALTFGDAFDADRVVTLQTPGGSGSLRVAAGVVLRATDSATVWVGEPTWANHIPLLGGAGLELKTVPYYDREDHSLRFDALCDALAEIPRGDILLMHACCHNPSGIDPTREQWGRIADIVVERGLIPFIDMAYQGFGDGLDEDAFAIRHLATRVPEMIVCSSCSKNFGLYRDRVGCLSILVADKATRDKLQSQANNVVRTLYSMPPDHGAAVVTDILTDAALRERWEAEVGGMRQRIADMRTLFRERLESAAPGTDFSHLTFAKGMFCFLGVSPEQVARLKQEHAVYMVDSSRINVAGINTENVDRLSASIAAVL